MRPSTHLIRIGLLVFAPLAGALPCTAENSWQQPINGQVIRLTALAKIAKDPTLFTQGLVIHDGSLYESSGGHGSSKLCKTPFPLAPLSQRHSHCRSMPKRLFAEGITPYKQYLLQLSWQRGELTLYAADDLRRIKTIHYRGQGWGLTHSPKYLIMSDGSDQLYFRNLDSFVIERSIKVSWKNKNVFQLNALQWVNGLIWANQWHSDQIYIIDPTNGAVLEVLDFSHLYPRTLRKNKEAVLNGIAYDTNKKQILLTGKNWPDYFLFQLREAEKR